MIILLYREAHYSFGGFEFGYIFVSAQGRRGEMEEIMEYTPMEKDVLAMMQRTDFKNISKGDVISFASKIGELRP